jgi:hypothetical protein
MQKLGRKWMVRSYSKSNSWTEMKLNLCAHYHHLFKQQYQSQHQTDFYSNQFTVRYLPKWP